MDYTTLTKWTLTEWTDDMEAMARDKYVPMIMSVGATRVRMIRTGELTFSVVTDYKDEATAKAATAKIAEIRLGARSEFSMTMDDEASGSVFAEG